MDDQAVYSDIQGLRSSDLAPFKDLNKIIVTCLMLYLAVEPFSVNIIPM